MLEDYLYKILESEKNNGVYLFKVDINPDYSIFKGHFPDMPVMPGVCTLDMTKQIISTAVGRSLRYSQIRDCKFLAAILPNENRELSVKLEIGDVEEGEYKVNCEIFSDERVMMKLKANLTDGK